MLITPPHNRILLPGMPGYSFRSSAAAFLPSDLDNLEAWYQFNTGITITGSGVSQWDDQSGNDRHLLQGTDTKRPSNSSGIITFDGVDNYLQTGSFVVAQPFTVYILVKALTWTGDDGIWDSVTGICKLFQKTTTPNICLYFGSSITACNSDLTLNTFHSNRVIANGASSSITVGDNTPTTGSPGANGIDGGFMLGRGDNPTFYANMEIKDVAIQGSAGSDDDWTNMKAYWDSL